jgi:hypothetical protein
MLPLSHDEALSKKAPSGHSPGPPDDRPDNPPVVVAEPADDSSMEVEEPPPARTNKENIPGISGRRKDTFTFVYGSPVEDTRTRKKPKKAPTTTRNPLSNVTNSNTSTDSAARTDKTLTSWVQRVANLTQELSTQLNSIQKLPNDPESLRHLKSIQRILFESSESLASALANPNERHEPRRPQTQNANDIVLNAIRDLSTRLESQEATLRDLKKSTPKPTQPQQTHTAPIPNLSYAKATTTPLTNQTANPTNQKQPTTHTNPPPQKTKSPARFVVRFKGNPPPLEERLSSERAVNRLNDRFKSLQTAQNKLRVVAAVSNQSGNYIVTFSDDSPLTLAEEHKEQLLFTLAPGYPNAVVTRDEIWKKVVIHDISLRDDNRYTRTEESLLEAVKVNSCLDNVTITQNPRWILPPEKLAGRRSSSIAFSFIDKPNSILPSLLNNPFHMFGAPKRVTLHWEFPKPLQCKKCWKFHNVKSCRARLPRCRRCGKHEPEDKHEAHCDECKKSPDANVVCTHSSCLNCHQNDHCANDPKCPKRIAQLALAKHTLSPPHKPNARQNRTTSQ